MATSPYNIRNHLEALQRALDAFNKFGDCPAIREEFNRLAFINKGIINKHNASKLTGNRKDIRS